MPVSGPCYMELLAYLMGVMVGRPEVMEVFLKGPCSPLDSPLFLVDHMSETGKTDLCQVSGLTAPNCQETCGSHTCRGR